MGLHGLSQGYIYLLQYVGIATGYGLKNQGYIPGRGKIFLFSTAFRPSLGTHPASYPMGTGGDFLEGKTAGVWNSPLTSI
jgi:hypothetical protein